MNIRFRLALPAIAASLLIAGASHAFGDSMSNAGSMSGHDAMAHATTSTTAMASDTSNAMAGDHMAMSKHKKTHAHGAMGSNAMGSNAMSSNAMGHDSMSGASQPAEPGGH